MSQVSLFALDYPVMRVMLALCRSIHLQSVTGLHMKYYEFRVCFSRFDLVVFATKFSGYGFSCVGFRSLLQCIIQAANTQK